MSHGDTDLAHGDTDLGLVLLILALAEYALRAKLLLPPTPSLMLLLLLGSGARPQLLLASTNPSSTMGARVSESERLAPRLHLALTGCDTLPAAAF